MSSTESEQIKCKIKAMNEAKEGGRWETKMKEGRERPTGGTGRHDNQPGTRPE